MPHLIYYMIVCSAVFSARANIISIREFINSSTENTIAAIWANLHFLTVIVKLRKFL